MTCSPACSYPGEFFFVCSPVCFLTSQKLYFFFYSTMLPSLFLLFGNDSQLTRKSKTSWFECDYLKKQIQEKILKIRWRKPKKHLKIIWRSCDCWEHWPSQVLLRHQWVLTTFLNYILYFMFYISSTQSNSTMTSVSINHSELWKLNHSDFWKLKVLFYFVFLVKSSFHIYVVL